MAKIYERIKQIGWIAMNSVRRKLDVNNQGNCFELFGLDFMIDMNLKVWLIEVNSNPCIE